MCARCSRPLDRISEWTGGQFDVTFGALSGLWKFDHDQDNVIPDMSEVRKRLPLVDYRAIQTDETTGTVYLARKGMSIHLGASARATQSIAAPPSCGATAFAIS